MTAPAWEYTNPSELATNRIYTEHELDQIRERIMFLLERPTVLNDLAREMRGHPLGDNEGSLLKLLNEDAITEIANNTWKKLWTYFITFGTSNAGIIAIFMTIHLIKDIIDIIIQGYTRGAIYGWPIHLLGALWSSVTYLLIHIARRPTDSNIELGEMQPKEQLNLKFVYFASFHSKSPNLGQSGVLPCMGIVRLCRRFTLSFPFVYVLF